MDHVICKDGCGAAIVDDQTLPEMIEKVKYRGATLDLKRRGEVYSYDFDVESFGVIKQRRYSHTNRDFVIDVAKQIRDVILARIETLKAPA